MENKTAVCLPQSAAIVAIQHESRDMFSLDVCFTDSEFANRYSFTPGQFNMLYLFGVGEVPISIVARQDEDNGFVIRHTIRRVGRVTAGLDLLTVGDTIGIRGPFGKGWPLNEAQGKNVIIMTGGLGCAPTVPVIYHILKHRDQYGHLMILQGVKHSKDLLFREQYKRWQTLPEVTVLLAADQAGIQWPWHKGSIVNLIDQLDLGSTPTVCMMCGPEAMMIAAIDPLIKKGLDEEAIYLNIERNMECGIGHCGHCMIGPFFLCKDGPVFNYSEIKSLLGLKGF